MAQVVDTKGNVRSGSRTSRPRHVSKKGGGLNALRQNLDNGLNALRQDLGINNLGMTPSQRQISGAKSQNELNQKLGVPQSISLGKMRKSSAKPDANPVPSSLPVDLPASIGSSRQGATISSPSFPSLSSSMPEGTASYSGDFKPVTPLRFDEVAETINDNTLKPVFGMDANTDYGEWEQEAAKRENRDVRTANVFDEEYDTRDGGILGIDYSYDAGIGNNPVNDTYARYLIDSGMPVDDVYAITHRPQSLDEDRQMRSERDVSPDLFDGSGEYLDDGSFNYYKLTSDAMTGTQYKKYRDELGMGGRRYIDPSETYSKREEARTYGFKPFIPDLATQASMVTQDWIDAPFEAGRSIAEGRRLVMPDYKANYTDHGGKRHSISGKGFDSTAPAFLNEFYYDRDYNPEKFVTEPDDDTPYTTMVNQYNVPDANGNDTYHYGHLVDVYKMPDDTYQLSFSDGSTVRTGEDYFNKIYDDVNEVVNIGNPERVPLQLASSIVDASAMGPDVHRGMVNETVVPDVNGNDTVHYGNLEGVSAVGDGSYVFTFQDGSSVNVARDYFDKLYDEETGNVSYPEFNRVWIDDVQGDVDLDRLGVELSEEEPQTYNDADVVYLPDLVLPDGERVALEDVERLVMDKTPGNDRNEYGISDDDISYDFANIIIPTLNNRPHRLGGQEIITDNGPDVSNLANNAVDWSLGSVPISVPGLLPWIYSMSGASRALSGIDPMSYDPVTKSYKLSAGYYDDDGNLRFGEYTDSHPKDAEPDAEPTKVRDEDRSNEIRWSGVLGNAAVPLTEMLVGPVGEELIPIGKLAERIPAKSATGRWLIDAATGAGGEGIEEVLGNIFEDGTGYGWSGLFADPVLDDNGQPVTDMYGHERRRTDQPGWLRSNNYVNDLQGNGNAFLGGALVDATLGLVPGLRGLGGAIMDDRRSIQSGTPLYVSPDEVERETFDDDYVTQVNNSMRRNR